jgi:hypothetical protein
MTYDWFDVISLLGPRHFHAEDRILVSKNTDKKRRLFCLLVPFFLVSAPF